ncbi:MAG: hypothetical protein AVDCRST_MAG95-3008 [uncultured Adhaeribacter sp.]|uniref:Uncharacterized protein n=1 Tax=uncultured Adhaeribacter sp. TaxID=448109 RepID=A0A6J4JBP8_9BACT|nr:MAG: hypothetical protein AVDCRST_MAG95-3008 [uncultured Adhaeribacter sp.]
MRNPSEKLAAKPLLHPINPIPTLPTGQNQSGFYDHLQHIWNNVALLQNIVTLENEMEKYNYAYRFAEIELEKVCAENAFLQHKMQALLAKP